MHPIPKLVSEYMSEGYSVIPLNPSKRPPIKWMHFQERLASEREVRAWRAECYGIATGRLSGLVVIDFDKPGQAELWWRSVARCGMVVRTRRGFHFYYQHPGGRVGNRKKATLDLSGGARIEFDVRGDGGYVVVPPSIIAGHRYHFLSGFGLKPKWALTPARPEWLNSAPAPLPAQRAARASFVTDRRFKRAKAYLARIEAASGSGGHNTTFRAACQCVRFGLDEKETLDCLLWWNEFGAKPPWTEKELRHKAAEAVKREMERISV